MIKIVLTGMCLLLVLSNNDVKALTLQTDSVGNYSIRGKIRNYGNGWIFLNYGDGLKKQKGIDSTRLVNGEFSFTGRVSGMEPFFLGVHHKDSKGKILPSYTYQGPFFLYPGHLYIEGEFDRRFPLIASGNKMQNEYNVFRKKVNLINDKLGQIREKINTTKKSDNIRYDSLNKQYLLYTDEIKQVVKDHTVQFPNSLVSAYIAKKELVNSDPNIVRLVYNELTTMVKESVYGKALRQMIQSSEPTAVGRISPSFTIPDSRGLLVSLEANKGTYTLIDFWASWCGPCRAENPNLIEAYNRYHAKGLKIISISMDTDKASWLKAVGEDKLTWLQLSDLKGMQSETGKKYGITMIPMNFLIDKEGKIVARNLKGMQLINKLREVF